jgi:small GTP-binding protein
LLFNQYLVKAQVWDTAGQERFESMTKAYFRNAVGALLVFDVTSRASYEHMKNKWLVQLREFGHEDMFVLIVGNKCDMDQKRFVTIAEAAEFAESSGLDYIETSARTGDHVEIAFRRVIMSVARLLPGIKEHIKDQKLPKGWIYLTDKEKYLNMWTGDLVSSLPDSPALTGLVVNGFVQNPEDMAFRDSATSVTPPLLTLPLPYPHSFSLRSSLAGRTSRFSTDAGAPSKNQVQTITSENLKKSHDEILVSKSTSTSTSCTQSDKRKHCFSSCVLL